MDYITNNEPILRLSAFFFFLLFIFTMESIFPIYRRSIKTYKRWLINFTFVFINTLALRLVFPILAVSFAAICSQYNIGILNYFNVSIWSAFILAFVLLDFGIWIQHLLFHHISFLWRFHKIHHSDEEVDFTTGVRFHPLEIIISMVYKLILIAVIGPSVSLVIVFEIVLNASSIFNHGNIKISKSFDIFLRKLIVTPNMHRIHHSEEERETNSNYGFNLSIWDKLFRTYKVNSKNRDNIITGLKELNNKKKSLYFLLLSPFKTNKE